MNDVFELLIIIKKFLINYFFYFKTNFLIDSKDDPLFFNLNREHTHLDHTLIKNKK